MSPDVAGREAPRAVVADDRRISPAAPLRAVVSARTWLAVIHLTAGIFVGAVSWLFSISETTFCT